MPKRGGATRRRAKQKSQPSGAKTDTPYKERPKNFNAAGCAVRPKTHKLGRMMKWPKYVRIQRQERVLRKRLKVPVAIAQFTRACDKNLANEAFKLFKKYSPPSKQERKKRLREIAEAKAKKEDVKIEHKKYVKFGLNHVTNLVKRKQALAVLIAHDVEPLEMVVWLPTLCHRMNVPYCIVKGKAALGRLVGMKTATCVALTQVESRDGRDLENLQASMRIKFNDVFKERRAMEPVFGVKTNHRLSKTQV